jgi:hypothetical protein
MTPVILVDGLQPRPIGSVANSTKTSGAVIALSLQSTVGVGSIRWTVDPGPGCTAVVANATPAYPFSTTCTITGVGTYRIKAVANENQAGNEIAVGAVAVLTTRRGIRRPIPGETSEWDATNGWDDAFGSMVTAIDNTGELDAIWANGLVRSIAGAITTTDATVTTAAQIDLQDNSATDLAVTVVGRSSTGASYRADLVGTYKRASAGAPTLVGAAPTVQNERKDSGTTGWTCALDISSPYVRVRVTGAAATSIAWTATIQSTRT